ncbi:hypothetical protein AB7M69_006611 [Bradyrhizobium japonicum]
MRRQHRHRLAQLGHGNGLGLHRVVGADHVLRNHAVEHAVTGFTCGLGIAIEPARLRRLRQRHQQRGFRQRQALRLLAEIGDRGRADAFEIAAIGREREIEVEDIGLAHAALDLDRAYDLAQLGIERALSPRLHQARKLHADGRAAGDDVAARRELQCGAPESERVKTVMRVEALVLIGEQQLEIGRIDVGLGIDRQPPAAVGHGIRAQQFSVAIDDCGGDRAGLVERERTEGIDPGDEADDGEDEGESGNREDTMTPAPHSVMAGLVPAIHVLFFSTKVRGCPGQARA